MATKVSSLLVERVIEETIAEAKQQFGVSFSKREIRAQMLKSFRLLDQHGDNPKTHGLIMKAYIKFLARRRRNA